ncbi:ATP-grasp domain-containing protein [Stieleria varia]|nr:ATP-grasp domain-containing protein [Stieleria varia]
MMQPTHEFRMPACDETSRLGPEWTPHVILIGASARAAAQSARLAGLIPITIDLFGDDDTQRLSRIWFSAVEMYENASKVAEVRHWLSRHVDDDVPVMLVGEFSGCVELARRLERPILGSTTAVPKQVNDHQFVESIAKQCGCVFPETRRTPPAIQAGWLSKMDSSSGGLGVRWSGDRKPDGSPPYWQRWHPGKLHGAHFLADGRDSVLMGVCRNSFTRLGDRPFVYSGSRGPIPVSSDVCEQLKKVGQAIAVQSGIVGLFNLDFLLHGDDVCLLEINARWSSGMEILDDWLQTVKGKPVASIIGDAYSLGTHQRPLEALAAAKRLSETVCQDNLVRLYKRVVFANRSGRFDPQRIPSEVLCGEQSLCDVPMAGTEIRRGEPILTIKWVRKGGVPKRHNQSEDKPTSLRALVRTIQGTVR